MVSQMYSTKHPLPCPKEESEQKQEKEWSFPRVSTIPSAHAPERDTSKRHGNEVISETEVLHLDAESQVKNVIYSFHFIQVVKSAFSN